MNDRRLARIKISKEILDDVAQQTTLRRVFAGLLVQHTFLDPMEYGVTTYVVHSERFAHVPPGNIIPLYHVIIHRVEGFQYGEWFEGTHVEFQQ